jgi:hypothetical protein
MQKSFFNFVFKRVALTLLFFTLTPVTLFASIMALVSISAKNETEPYIAQPTAMQNIKVYTATKNSNDFPTINIQVVPDDARATIIRNYLEKENSPLAPYSDLIVEVSDKYGLDYRLLPAIAQKESGLCRVIPEGSHNCWGWGIHSKGTLMFDSYPEALETVAKGLRENYIDKGYVTAEQIMKKYAHPDSTTWANGVNFYMDQLE